jgi:sec-independent protein translocase protein TatB
MFEVGFSEILLILVIALLVLGPERLPKLAADVGRWMGRARSMARQLRSQLDQEVQLEEMLREQKSSPASSADAHGGAAAATDAATAAAPPEASPIDEARADEAPDANANPGAWDDPSLAPSSVTAAPEPVPVAPSHEQPSDARHS